MLRCCASTGRPVFFHVFAFALVAGVHDIALRARSLRAARSCIASSQHRVFGRRAAPDFNATRHAHAERRLHSACPNQVPTDTHTCGANVMTVTRIKRRPLPRRQTRCLPWGQGHGALSAAAQVTRSASSATLCIWHKHKQTPKHQTSLSKDAACACVPKLRLSRPYRLALRCLKTSGDKQGRSCAQTQSARELSSSGAQLAKKSASLVELLSIMSCPWHRRTSAADGRGEAMRKQ